MRGWRQRIYDFLAKIFSPYLTTVIKRKIISMVQKKWKSLIMLTIAAALLAGAGGTACAEESAEVAVPAKQEAMAVPRKVTYTADDKARYEALREKNKGRLAPKERFLTTTAQKVVLTFGGLTRKESVEDILDHLDRMGVKATFFVTELELRKYTDTVREIAARGHELGLGLRTGTDGDFYETCAQIERLQKNMQRLFGVRPVIARQVFGTEIPTVNEAASAMGIELLGQTVNMVQTKDKEAKKVEDISDHLFGKFILAMGRGQIIYGRLDFLEDPKLTGDLLDWIKKNKVDSAAYVTLLDSPETNTENDSAYRMGAVREVLGDELHRWTYPVPEEKVLFPLRREKRRKSGTDRLFRHEFSMRYIGSPKVTETDRIRGFSEAEREQMDHTGIVKDVRDNTVFLTFDDWGTDASLNHLLYVLRKHHAKGTFFIITWNVKNNPNLLRAIAEGGHDIASHTNRHRPMVWQTSNYGGNMTPMTEEEYAEDVRLSYEELKKTVGDVMVDGKPALTHYLRPPTLAISKSGIRSIMDAGFSYIVSGYESTGDYATPSLQAMIGAISHGIYDEKGNVRKGSILIMHMTDNAAYTAEALDYILTVNEARDDNDPKKFKMGRLSDHLKEGYDQSIETTEDLEKHLSYKGSCGH